jgi:hypothetical protein
VEVRRERTAEPSGTMAVSMPGKAEVRYAALVSSRAVARTRKPAARRASTR